jgi:glycerate dehydrogenase
VLYDLKSGPLEKEFVDELKEFAESVKVVFAEKEYARALKLPDLKDADALVTRIFDDYEDSLFEESNLKYIGTMHTDVSHFNANVLAKKGIVLANVPDYATEAVAELTISALLNITRQTHDAMNFVKQGNWGFEKFMGSELKGRIFGIIGLGKIGTRVAEIAQAFGMEVVYFSKTRNPEMESKGLIFLDIDELLERSDVVSLHCPLNKETENLLSKEKLSMIRAGSVLLNPGRSELVDLDALYNLCSEKRLAAWFEAIEEKKAREKFRKLDLFYMTPHFGWMTREAQKKLRNITLDNIKSFLEGNPKNKVN